MYHRYEIDLSKWDKYKIGKTKYDSRYNYYRLNTSNGVYYQRKTKLRWIILQYLGKKLKQIIYKLHGKLGKRRKPTENEIAYARELSSRPYIRVSYDEYIKRFTSTNPYVVKPWSTILWFIRRNITND